MRGRMTILLFSKKIFLQRYEMNHSRLKTQRMSRASVLFLLLIIIGIAPAAAIGVSGAIYKGSIAPGGTDTLRMIVSNGADETPANIQATVMGFGQGPDQSYYALDPAKDPGQYSARNFITLDNSSFYLKPGTSQTIVATITLPQNTGAGGRYAIISIHGIPSNGAPMSTGVNVPVLITVAGSAQTQAGSIANIDTETSGHTMVATTVFQNTGNCHYYYTVNKIAVLDGQGNILQNVTSTPSMFAIIPGSTVNYTAKTDVSGLAYGNYMIKSEVLLPDGKVLAEKTTPFAFQEPSAPVSTTAGVPPATAGSTQGPASAGSPADTPTKASLPVGLGVLSIAAVTIIVGATAGRRK